MICNEYEIQSYNKIIIRVIFFIYELSKVNIGAIFK